MTYLDYAQLGFIIVIVVIGVGGLIKVTLLDKD